MPNKVAERTIAVIAKHSGIEPTRIALETELSELGLDSLKLTEVVLDLEELFDIEIDLNAAEAWDTLKNVGDILHAMNEFVDARN